MASYPNHDRLVIFDADGTTIDAFDNFACIPLGEGKTHQFRQVRERLAINPARCFACGDEYSDYAAAIGAAMYPFIVAYGAEDRLRLRVSFGVPDEFIHASPAEFTERLLHALGLAGAPTQDVVGWDRVDTPTACRACRA